MNKKAIIQYLQTHIPKLLAQGGWIDAALADSLKRMVGFRNIAIHDYQTLHQPITVAIINYHLNDFLRYSQTLLQKETRDLRQ